MMKLKIKLKINHVALKITQNLQMIKFNPEIYS